MLFAIDSMSADVTAIFYIAAVVVAAVAALGTVPRLQLGWAAFALFVFPAAWNAAALAGW